MNGPFGGPPSPGAPGQPQGYYQQPGYPSPYGQSPPAPSRMSTGTIVAVFVGVLLTLALIAGVFIVLNQPAPPVPPCPPAQPCAPIPSLPTVGSSPLPISTPRPPNASGALASPVAPASPGASLPPVPSPSSDSPPVVSGTLYTDAKLGYAFEYDPDVFTLADSGDGFAVFNGNVFDAQVWIDAKTADTSPKKMIESELGDVDRFLIARVADTDTYDALLGPSIGYVAGEGSVWSGTLLSRDGTPLAPGGVTIASATDGRITVAIVVIVGTPDSRQGGDTQQHAARAAADDILKSFKWSVQ